MFTTGIKQRSPHHASFFAMIAQMNNCTIGIQAKRPNCPALLADFHIPAHAIIWSRKHIKMINRIVPAIAPPTAPAAPLVIFGSIVVMNLSPIDIQ